MPHLPVSAINTSASQDWQSYTTISRPLLWVLQRLLLTLDFSHISGSSIPSQTFFWVHFAFQQPSWLTFKTTLISFLTLMATSGKTEIYSLSRSTWGVKVKTLCSTFSLSSFLSKIKQQQSFTLLCLRHDSSIQPWGHMSNPLVAPVKT